MQDNTSISRIAHLITSYIAKIQTHSEAHELEQWVGANYNNQLLFAELLIDWNIKSVCNNTLELLRE